MCAAEDGKKDARASYNRLKIHEGQVYRGMKVGGRHKWYYDKGEWREQKVTPDRWRFSYSVKKRRAGHAPEGSGAPVGTEYHWYILASQKVKKLDANAYSTDMEGAKIKIAHKNATTGKWSASEKAQQKKLIRVLEDMAAELRANLEEGEPVTGTEVPLPPKAARRARGGRAKHPAKVDTRAGRAGT